MLEKNDLRGIITIFVLMLFAAVIFVPAVFKLEIPDPLLQTVISITTMVATFYFTNKATKDNFKG